MVRAASVSETDAPRQAEIAVSARREQPWRAYAPCRPALPSRYSSSARSSTVSSSRRLPCHSCSSSAATASRLSSIAFACSAAAAGQIVADDQLVRQAGVAQDPVPHPDRGGRDVLLALAQRRQLQHDARQPPVEVVAEPPGAHLRPQVVIRHRDRADAPAPAARALVLRRGSTRPVFSKRISAACVRGPRPAVSPISSVPPAAAAAAPPPLAVAGQHRQRVVVGETDDVETHQRPVGADAAGAARAPARPCPCPARPAARSSSGRAVPAAAPRRPAPRSSRDAATSCGSARRSSARRPDAACAAPACGARRARRVRGSRARNGSAGSRATFLWLASSAHPRLMPSSRSIVAWSAAGKRYFSNSPDVTQRQSATRTAFGSTSPTIVAWYSARSTE